MFRRLVEITSRKLVYRRHLPARFGSRAFYASPEGGLRYLLPDLFQVDPVLLETTFRTVSAGDFVWDIGANVGLFSFAAAGIAGPSGRIFAIEPDMFLINLLRRSAAIQSPGCAPVSVLPVAVAETTTVADFCIASRARASNHLDGLGTTQSGGVRERQTVMAVSLDWLLTKIAPPQVLKIDTEGAEIGILKGGHELLMRYRPKILCEVAKENARQATRIFFDHGYEIFDAENPDDPIDLAVWNTIALPA